MQIQTGPTDSKTLCWFGKDLEKIDGMNCAENSDSEFGDPLLPLKNAYWQTESLDKIRVKKKAELIKYAFSVICTLGKLGVRESCEEVCARQLSMSYQFDF